jgi:quaternary ammonium compound-resistance protein SugE
MNWLILLLAGLLEVCWAVGLKYTEGFTRPIPSIATVAAMVASLYLLGLAMRSLPVGAAYAVWVGIGIVGAVILGAILFQEPLSLPKVVSILLIVAGIIGLRLPVAA